jgi:transposase
MAKPYSEDLRSRAVETILDGATIPETAEYHGLSISSIVRFLKLHRETGSVSPAKFGGYKDFALAEHEELVRQLVADQPDITLEELVARLAKKKVTVGKSSVSDPRRLVFLDETAVSTTIMRLYGRAPQDERLVQKVPHGNWKTITFIAALRHNRVTAPFVLEGAMTGEIFRAYVKQFLAPTLKRGDIVFMDNASVHKVNGIEEAIEARGAILVYLPSYSPDFNPIEQFFSKLKAMLRTLAAYFRKGVTFTVDSLCEAISSCLDEISRSECAAYLANSGYGQPNREML